MYSRLDQSIAGKTNLSFVRRFGDRYHRRRVLSDPMQSAWNAVHIWAAAVEPEAAAQAAVHPPRDDTVDGVELLSKYGRNESSSQSVGKSIAQKLSEIKPTNCGKVYCGSWY